MYSPSLDGQITIPALNRYKRTLDGLIKTNLNKQRLPILLKLIITQIKL